MARYEFKFAVSEVELSEEDVKRIGLAVTQAGAAVVADVLPEPPATFMLDWHHGWCGFVRDPEALAGLVDVARAE